MAYIPSDTEWYLADLIIEIRVEKDPRCVVHINTVLVHANSPTDAYEKALTLGAEQASSTYLNPAGQRVNSRFIGLKDLAVIHEKLEHGAELFFVERTDFQPGDASSLAQTKEKLSVFLDAEPSVGVDYSSGQIAEDYKKIIE
ncbi:MAG: DUF4288 domain-containing protein [Polaromonas sp.]